MNILIAKKNDSLRDILNQNSVTTSNLIINSQKKSAKQLTIAAKNLKTFINGTDIVPEFSFYGSSTADLIGQFTNKSSQPAYNINGAIYDFSKLEQCPLEPIAKTIYSYIKADCFFENEKLLGLDPILDGGSAKKIILPNYTSALKGKFLLKVLFKSKTYFEEGIFKAENNILYQSTRILFVSTKNKYFAERVIKSWIIKPISIKFFYKNVNWNKEFPDKYVLNIHTRSRF